MLRPRPRVLVVDREGDATRLLIAFLRGQELEVLWARDAEAAWSVLDAQPIDCVVLELRLQHGDGLSVLRRARERNPELCAVVVTEGGDIEAAVEAMREGAYDFQVKPLNLEKLMAVLGRGFSHQALAARMIEIEGQLDERLLLDRLTGSTRAIQRVMEQVRSIGGTRATVLVEGETGTGKGLVAQALHRNSPRRTERFVAIHCGALVGEMLESELFGYERGAYAGSSALHRGGFESADQGTLFLDEIDQAPPGVQIKLLRVLQDRAFERVGGTGTVKVDVRLIVATHKDLAADVQAGRFREDLLQRLGAVRIRMPALHERREDIPLLVEAFVREFNRGHGRKVAGVTRGVLERLMHYAWPGNVRELRNTIEGMLVSAGGRRTLELSDLPEALREPEPGTPPLSLTVGMTVEEAERQLIAATLEHVGRDKPRAAAMLGIGLRTLYRKIEQYGLK